MVRHHQEPSRIAVNMAQGLGEGLAFCPQDQELVDLFLRSKIAGQPLDARFIHNADLYSAAPDELVDKRAPGSGDGDSRVWYFFTPVHCCTRKNGRGERTSRTVGSDGNKWWHSEVGQKPVKGSAVGGYVQKFTYKVKTASGTVKPGWLMVEYGIHQEHGGGDLVLCKVYRSPRTTRSGSLSSSCTSASSTSTAALSLSGFGCKRKAAGDHTEAPPCSVRRQTDEEDDLMLADDIERALIASSGELDDSAASEYYRGTTHMPGGEHSKSEVTSFLSAGGELIAEAGDECSSGMPTSAPSCSDVELCLLESSCMPEPPTPATIEPEQKVDGGQIELFDAGVTVGDLLDPALGECNGGGLPCAASAPPCGDELLSASGDTTQQTTQASSVGGVELCSAAGGMSLPEHDALYGLAGYQLLFTYLPPSRCDEDDDDTLWSENVATSPLFASSIDAFWSTQSGCWMY